MNPDDIRQSVRATDRRQDQGRREESSGGRRQTDHVVLSARDVLDLARREELIAVEVLAEALRVSRKTLLRDWQSRHLPTTSVGRRVWLASALVVREYFSHAVERP